jgi:two-component system cell cycle response regulator
MKTEVKVLLLGFMPFEKATFESFFNLVARGGTLYQIVPEASQAQVLIVNGDNPTAMQWANESIKPPQKAVFIGKADSAGKWPMAPKPIKLTTVLGLLDLLTKADKRVAEANMMDAPAPAQPQAAVAVQASVRKNTVRQGTGGKGISGFFGSDFIGLGDAPTPITSAQQFDNILVVDHSDTALKFMQNRLARYGFRAELAKSGEEALVRIATGTYKFVFLEVAMGSIDGYQICRAIKQQKYTSSKPPVVVMLTSRSGSADKIRGGLAGCDAYLTKPLNEAELLKVLSKYDEQVERSFRDTGLRGEGVSSLRPST